MTRFSFLLRQSNIAAILPLNTITQNAELVRRTLLKLATDFSIGGDVQHTVTRLFRAVGAPDSNRVLSMTKS